MTSSPMNVELEGGRPAATAAPTGGALEEEREASPMKKQRGDDVQPVTLDLIREAMRMELGRSRDELNQAMATVRDEVTLFGQRVDSIESGVTKQMDTTNKMLSIITTNHDKQTEADAPRRPALILGGWPDDQAASGHLEEGQGHLASIGCPS